MLSQSITNRGDLEQSMAESAYTTQGVYETQMIEHGFMEPEACVAYPSATTRRFCPLTPRPPLPRGERGSKSVFAGSLLL